MRIPQRVFVLTLVGYLLMTAAWALALPTNGTYDEQDHAVRAYAVASGQLYADGDAVLAPRSLLPKHVDCAWGRTPESAACQQPIADSSLVRTKTTAARYSPVYYLPVGLPLLVSPDHTGIILARLVSGLLTALLLASAFATAAWLGNRLLLAGLTLATTPMVLNLAGAINPNGLEIAAGYALWTALLALLLGPVAAPDRVARRLVWLASVSAALLITVRQLGPLLLAMSVLAVVLLAQRGRIAGLLARPELRRIGGGLVVASAVFFLMWTLTSRIADPAPSPHTTPRPMPFTQAVDGILTVRLPFYAKQLIGQFSYGETTLPWWLVGGWYLLILALVVPAALLAGWRYRLVNLGLFATLFALLAALELYFLPFSGWFSHGRYAMPAGVGLLLLPAFVPRLAALPGGLIRWFARVAVVVTGLFHLGAYAKVASRFFNGPAAPVDPFTGEWLPPTGPLLPLLVAVLGVALLVGITWHVTGAPARLEPEADQPPSPPEPACNAPSTGTTSRPARS